MIQTFYSINVFLLSASQCDPVTQCDYTRFLFDITSWCYMSFFQFIEAILIFEYL